MDDAIYCQSIVEACNIIKPLLVNKIKEIDKAYSIVEFAKDLDIKDLIKDGYLHLKNAAENIVIEER